MAHWQQDISDMTEKFTIIDTCASLEKLAGNLEKASIIACDLEADSMYHYREKVCLLQMATHSGTYVVDPLAIGQLDPLKPLFADPKKRKIFHGADYDIRSLFRDFHIEIGNLFDTEMACRFLGIRSTGLEPVLKKRFNVSLDKKFQKRDWSQRPLSDQMLCYAASDTTYLVELSEILAKELTDKGRLSWVREECDILTRVRPAPADNGPLYLKFKGAGRLNRRNLAVLEGLLVFRQCVARKKDKPLFKIISNEALLKIVAARPNDLKDLKKAKALSPKQNAMFGNNIIQIVRTTLETPSKDLPAYPRRKSPPIKPTAPNRINVLKTWRDNKAKALKLNPALLFNKSLLAAIAHTRPLAMRQFDAIAEMKEWQKKEFGKEIIAQLKTVP